MLVVAYRHVAVEKELFAVLLLPKATDDIQLAVLAFPKDDA